MTANQAEYSAQLMSRTLGVSRSALDAYHSRPFCGRQISDVALTDRIVAIHEASKETYGAPRSADGSVLIYCATPGNSGAGIWGELTAIQRVQM